jgi:transposase
MQDCQLYEQILGICSPWYVERVELKVEQGQGAVRVYLNHHPIQTWPCAECGQECVLYDHQPERQWRHLDTCQYQTILHAAPPRTNCSEHGARVVKLSWAAPGSRFTALFERLAIDWLKVASQKAVGQQLSLSWDEIHGILDRAVERGLKRRQAETVKRIGVDEKAFRKGHRYLTLVNDLDRGRALYVAEDRKQSSLDGFWSTQSPEQLNGIEAVAMDMWDPYIASTKEHLPDADSKIVFDKFHIAKHLGEAVDQVRRQENRQLRSQGDDRLVGTKYDWLRHPGSFAADAWKKFKSLRDSTLKTARAWALKETAMTLFNYRYTAAARSFFQRWYGWSSRCRLKPMIEVGRMLKRRIDNILTFITHGVTNAASESLNAKIQWVKYTARGFRNQKNFINAIYFHCGGLDLAP